MGGAQRGSVLRWRVGSGFTGAGSTAAGARTTALAIGNQGAPAARAGTHGAAAKVRNRRCSASSGKGQGSFQRAAGAALALLEKEQRLKQVVLPGLHSRKLPAASKSAIIHHTQSGSDGKNPLLMSR